MNVAESLAFARSYATQPRTRKRWRIAAAWLKGDGIEIGALYRPLIVPPQARVRYADHLDEQGLRDHYPELANEKFAPVDIIGTAEDLSNIDADSLDFIIANHLFEHLEYPIKALGEFQRVLRAGGVLYMALPDQRVGIDHRRPVTRIEHLLDEHRNGAEKNRVDHYRSWVVDCEGLPEQADERTAMLMAMNYSIHFHVWRADGFLEFLAAAKKEANLDFELVAFSPPEYPGDDEFIIVLSKGATDSPRLPLRQTASMRERLKRSPLGPTLAAGKGMLRRVATRRGASRGHS
jgi:SAM-dependent methyltransferase